MPIDRTLLKKSIVTGSLIFIGTEMLLTGGVILLKTLRPEGVPEEFLYHQLSPYLVCLSVFRVLLWVLRPFSTILGHLHFYMFYRPVFSWGINLLGWVAISWCVLKRKAEGKSCTLIPEKGQKILKGRFQALGMHFLIGAGCVVIGLCFYGLVIWLTPPEILGGPKNLSAIGLILDGKTKLFSWWSGVFIFFGTLMFVLAFASIPHGLFIFFTGQAVLTNYFCPHCGHIFFGDLPDPDTVFSCPRCKKSIRRSTWEGEESITMIRKALKEYILILLFAVIFLFPVLAPFSAGAANRAYVPAEGRLLIIGQQKETMEKYIEAFHIVPAGFMLYTSLQELEGLDQPSDKGAGVHHGQYWIDTYPGTVLQIGLYLVGTLPDILEGQYDQNIERLGAWIQNANCPVYLRIGYEFDNKENFYDPAQYQAAFRYIVNRFRKQGITNVAFVWHSGTFFDQQDNFLSWYPGDEYVDWFGFSFFATQQRGIIEKFCSLARKNKKPIMIAESAPAGLYTTRGRIEWFKQLFSLINKEDVQCVSYINSHWDRLPMFEHMKWGDSRIQNDEDVQKLWLSQVREPAFLMYSPQLFKTLDFAPQE